MSNSTVNNQQVNNTGCIGNLSSSGNMGDGSATHTSTHPPHPKHCGKTAKLVGVLFLFIGVMVAAGVAAMEIFSAHKLPPAAGSTLRLLVAMLVSGGTVFFGDKASSNLSVSQTEKFNIYGRVSGYVAAVIFLYAALWLLRWP